MLDVIDLFCMECIPLSGWNTYTYKWNAFFHTKLSQRKHSHGKWMVLQSALVVSFFGTYICIITILRLHHRQMLKPHTLLLCFETLSQIIFLDFQMQTVFIIADFFMFYLQEFSILLFHYKKRRKLACFLLSTNQPTNRCMKSISIGLSEATQY